MTTKVTDDVILSNAFLITLLVKEISLQISNFGFYYVLYSIKKVLYIERIIINFSVTFCVIYSFLDKISEFFIFPADPYFYGEPLDLRAPTFPVWSAAPLD